MKRVCLLCETWTSGGIESFLSNVLTHADLSGLEVDIVAARLGESVFTRALEGLGVQFIQLSGSPRRPGENYRQFRRLLEQRSYDAVHLNAFQGLSLYYLKLAARAGVPVRIAHSHNTALRESPTRGLKLRLHRWGCRRYAEYATDFWACSAAAAEFMFGGRAFRLIPNGIETERFRFDPAAREQVREELGAGAGLVIGHVGRLCGQKNQRFLLDVFARVGQARPDSLLLLVGEGEDLETLREKAAALGIVHRVIFYGAADRVERLYWAMDVFAFPSLFEGLGIAAVEAQCAGLPVLCSEFVPAEALLTGRARRLPLTAEGWARELAQARAAEREKAAGEVRAAGFDAADSARLVTEGWWGHG